VIHIAGNTINGTAIATIITQANFQVVFVLSQLLSLISNNPAQLIS